MYIVLGVTAPTHRTWSVPAVDALSGERDTDSLIAGASSKQPRRERPGEATLVGHLDGIACSP